ncbi:MAG TPA: hypothetical protein VJU84_02765 [Pyrinomonadaceae bacterium]|nr:hypothetical protein [Pyrinomonadaceae bacterium]
MADPPFDLSKFDPSSLDLSHLHEGEQNRIRNRQLSTQEISLLLSGQNPWTKSGKPNPLPAPKSAQIEKIESALNLSETEAEQFLESQLKPTEIPEPTEAEVLSIMHDDDLVEYRSSSDLSERRRSMFQFYKDQWKAQRAFEERSKEVEAARKAVNAELAAKSDRLAEKSDVDKAVESLASREPSPEEQNATPSEEPTREDTRRALSNEKWSATEYRRRKVEREAARDNPAESPETKPTQSADQTESDPTIDALTEKLRQSPEVQKWIAGEQSVRNLFEQLAHPKRKETPRAYRTAFDMLRAEAVAEAEKARQEVIKRYREKEKAKSNRAAGQAELQREREKIREEGQRRADLRKQVGRGASLWPGADEQHARRMQSAFENKPERVPPSHRVSRVVAGGLFALFFGSLIQALTVFGVITMNSGHVFMVIAFIAGALLLTTEILPVKPRKQKILSVLILGLVLLAIDLASVWYTTKETVKTPPPVTLIKHTGSFFFATYPQPFMYELGDDSLVPIALDLAVAITNNRGTATRIIEYAAEIQTRDGTWHRLISLPMSPPRTILFLNRFDIRRGMKCQLEPPAFDAVADRREIGVGETIEGQMFFELPRHLRYETVSYGKLKVSATNIQGERSEAIFDNPPAPSVTGASQINGGFTWCPGEPNQAIDLSRKLIRPLQE